MRPDRDLDRELRDLGPRVEYPPVPDLARSVRSRLEADQREGRGRPFPPWAGWMTVAAALVVLASVALTQRARVGHAAGHAARRGWRARAGVP